MNQMDENLRSLLFNDSFNNIMNRDNITLIELEILVALLIKRNISFKIEFLQSTTINTVVETSVPPIQTKPKLIIEIGRVTDVTSIRKIIFLNC